MASVELARRQEPGSKYLAASSNELVTQTGRAAGAGGPLGVSREQPSSVRLAEQRERVQASSHTSTTQ